jgi:hypothetical protein
MPFERPHLLVEQVQPGDRLLACSALDPNRPGPALPLITGMVVRAEAVVLVLEGWKHEVELRRGTPVIVEREVT